VHGSIIHDASYYSLIELKGAERILKLILEASCDPQGPSPGSKRYVVQYTASDLGLILNISYCGGSRSFETHIYEPGFYPFGLIGPTTVIWQPFADSKVSTDEDSEAEGEVPDGDKSDNTEKTPEPLRHPPKRKRKAKKKPSEDPKEATPDTIRVVWLRSHPSVHKDVFSSLQTAVALTLEAAKRTSAPPNINIEVEMADLRGQVNAFEIMGPKASQVLRGALSPIPQDKREDFTKVYILSPPW
jgi:ribonuclease P/MRP protein subunit POP1